MLIFFSHVLREAMDFFSSISHVKKKNFFMVVAIFINYEIKITMHSHLKQRLKLYPKRHAKHYIVYKIYFIKTQKKSSD